MSSESNSGGGDSEMGHARGNQLMLVPNSSSVETSVEMPTAIPAQRQRNLQDLLRLCTQVSDPNSSVGPMDEERKLFLEQALKSLSIDVIEVLMKAVQLLKQADALSPEDDPSQCEMALEDILEYVDNIDFANDFHKIGGFSILLCCLKCVHASVRWRAAQLVGELTQNNPYCQRYVLEANLLPVLLSLLDSDPDQTVRIKALHALSCLVRNNEQALTAFLQQDGFSVLLRALQTDVEKLQVKAAFFLSTLRQQAVRDELVKMGFVELFATLVCREVSHSTEHLLSALVMLVTDCPAAQMECQRPELHLRKRLTQLMEVCQDKDEYQEVCKHCQDLLTSLFEDDSEEDR